MTQPFQQKIVDLGIGSYQWHWTAASSGQEGTFRKMIESVQPLRIVEIGTHEGVSTALLAEYAPVTTVDIFPSDTKRHNLWEVLGVTEKIREEVHRDQIGRDDAIKSAIAKADFAFIDGCHLYRDVEYDFELCLPCGAILFHDYWLSPHRNAWPDVRRFVDQLDTKKFTIIIDKPFALIRPR